MTIVRIVLLCLLMMSGIARADASLQTPGNNDWTFCEFDVVRAEDGKPTGGMRYKLKLPSGQVVRGRVPKNGRVHVDVRGAGTCTIDFDLPPGMIIAD
jgi:hypothetical protein